MATGFLSGGTERVADHAPRVAVQTGGAAFELRVAARRAPDLDVQARAGLVVLHGIPQRAERVGGLRHRTVTVLDRLAQAIEVAVVRVALDLMDERRFAGEVIMHDALAEPELLADFGERRCREAFAREALGGGGKD